MRFTTLSCKTQRYYACSCRKEQPWRSHFTAICRHWVAKHTRTTHNGSTNCCDFAAPKPGFRRQSRKTTILKRVLKGNFKRKIINAKIQKRLLPKHHSHVSRCHYNAIYDSQLQNAMVLRMQLPQGATLTQPLHCDLQTLSCKTR